MAQIINFPNESERDWLELETIFRNTYKDLPDGLETFEECIPAIKAHWKEIFISFSIQPSYQIPGELTDEQSAAVHVALMTGINLMADRLRRERGKHLGALAACEFKSAYLRRNGI